MTNMYSDDKAEAEYSTKLLKCRKCSTITTKEPEPHPSCSYCMTCVCSNSDCTEFWYICPLHSCRFASTKYSKMRNHFMTIDHSGSPDRKGAINSSNNSQEVDSDFVGDFTDESYSQHHQSKRPRLTTDDSNINETSNLFPESILNSATKRFFDEDCKLSNSGIRGLVSRAFRQDNNAEIVANFNESNLHLNITHFCSTLSKSQQSDFASIVANLISKETFDSTRPPMSYNDINKLYMSSKFSIYNNIPSPTVFEIDNHACVSIENIINLILSFGVELNTINLHTNFEELTSRTNCIQNTKEVENIVKKIKLANNNNIMEINPIVIYVIIWSDDFEANNTRKNRNSTWVKTVTICPPRSDSTSPLYTYPIAIGRKGQSHDIVNNFFNNELERLSKCTLRFSQKFKNLYPVIVHPLCLSADRPERSSINCILSHQGSSTKRWMYSELIPRKKLPSCTSCFETRWKKLDGTNLKKNHPVNDVVIGSWKKIILQLIFSLLSIIQLKNIQKAHLPQKDVMYAPHFRSYHQFVLLIKF